MVRDTDNENEIIYLAHPCIIGGGQARIYAWTAHLHQQHEKWSGFEPGTTDPNHYTILLLAENCKFHSHLCSQAEDNWKPSKPTLKLFYKRKNRKICLLDKIFLISPSKNCLDILQLVVECWMIVDTGWLFPFILLGIPPNSLWPLYPKFKSTMHQI